MTANLTVSATVAFRVVALFLLSVLTYFAKVDHEKLWANDAVVISHGARLTEIERRLNSRRSPISLDTAPYGESPG